MDRAVDFLVRFAGLGVGFVAEVEERFRFPPLGLSIGCDCWRGGWEYIESNLW